MKGAPNMTDLTCIDLFCGAGGLSYGLHMAGIKTVLGIDFDQSAIETFNQNKLGKGIVADIEKKTSEEIKRLCNGRKIDLVVGGPPCQGFSLSGFRDESDKRNRLYQAFVRVVRDIRPRGFVLENVPGLVSLFDGRAKNSILEEFSNLGYTVVYKILTASEFGVPQHRRRVVFVGLKGKEFSFPMPTHFVNPVDKTQKRMVSCSDALRDLPPLPNTDDLGSDVQDYASAPDCDFQRMMRRGSKAVYNHIAARHSEKVRSIIAKVPPGQNYKSLPDSLRGVRNFHVAWTRFPENEPSPTIDTGHRHHFHYKECRVPTVRDLGKALKEALNG